MKLARRRAPLPAQLRAILHWVSKRKKLAGWLYLLPLISISLIVILDQL